MVKLLSAVLALATAASASVINARAPAVCNADNCLRALRNTQFPTRGSTDCAAYLRTTVTPATVTVTATATSSVFSTSIIGVTLTSSVEETATDTVLQTNIQTATVTLAPQPFKRADTNTVPAYASACSGQVRYSSACSCLGGSVVTVTAAAPTSTVTTTQTSYTTEDLTSTIDTTIITSTQKVSITSTSDVTTTVTATPTQTAFVMQVYGMSGANANLNGQYMQTTVLFDFKGLVLTPDINAAQKLIKGQGASVGQVLDAAGSGDALFAMVENVWSWIGLGKKSVYGAKPTPLVCTYAADNAMSCGEVGFPDFSVFGWYTGYMTIDKIATNVGPANVLKFKAVPLV
ncbi:hypothetical protein VTL71DRAFT_2179 [Oculimacula yallundae]|uniref:Uncharacterized protein n=1 Tax=Oculimacula yallundae TaxID=86028 RepID=A0ABR4C860_9HELO